jgi:hypothetical protein
LNQLLTLAAESPKYARTTKAEREARPGGSASLVTYQKGRFEEESMVGLPPRFATASVLLCAFHPVTAAKEATPSASAMPAEPGQLIGNVVEERPRASATVALTLPTGDEFVVSDCTAATYRNSGTGPAVLMLLAIVLSVGLRSPPA